LKAFDYHLINLKKDTRSIYYKSLKRWISEKVRFKLPAWVEVVGLVAGIVLLTSLLGSIVLKHQVNARSRELHEVNRVLRASERKYRELVMLANSIILRWSQDGRITFLNEFGQRFFGYTEKEILGRNVLGTIVPEDESTGRNLRSLMEEILNDPQKFERNINENMRRNGERVWIDWTNKVVLDEQGQIKEILSIGSDITDRKLAEGQIRRLNDDLRRHAEVLEQRVAERTAELVIAKDRAESADRIKSAFLATMSHELRTPLNSIIGFTGIMLQGLAGPLNEEQQKQLNMVQSSSRHLLSLINDVLDISKIEAGQLALSVTSFELRPSIEKMVKLVLPLAEKKGLDLRVDIADDIKTATTDQLRLEQVILNLLNNAVKFTEKGHVRISCRSENDQYLLSVSDTGPGMRPEELPGLFQPFHQIDTGLTRKHEGTGLGLSICKKLLGMMGGTIDVRSRWGQGSTFTIRFPIQAGGSA
jgi:PAS domain S-box-containing protein